MKVGDLVYYNMEEQDPRRYGLVIEVVTRKRMGLPMIHPPLCRMLYPDGSIEKEWADELEIVNKERAEVRA